MFPSDTKFTVYCRECWLSDRWDPAQYAMEYDFHKPFFEQFRGLFLKVPRLGKIQQGNILNSEYCNRVSDLKNCYLVFGSTDDENCYYSSMAWGNREVIDCYNPQKCERSYQLINCYNSSNLYYSQECHNCSDSYFLQNCRNCTSCFGCVNLRNKQYYIFNQPYSREEYLKELEKFNFGSRKTLNEIREKFRQLKAKYIVPAIIENRSNDVSGNWIEACKNVHQGFATSEVEDGKYLFDVFQAKDVMDYSYWGKNSELIYESVNVGRQCSNVAFSNECWDELIDSRYCSNCHSSSDLFGCVGLRKKQYCILNKQYREEEYRKLVESIKQQMDSLPYMDEKGRSYKFGEFFPPEIMPFGYNETTAQEYFPITKKEALHQGFDWRESGDKNYSITLKAEDIPDDIRELNFDILKEVIGCRHKEECNHTCSGAFKVTEFELNFYKDFNIPLPNLCSNCRHFERSEEMTPMKLFSGHCNCLGEKSTGGIYQNQVNHFHGKEKCPNEFETSYSPDQGKIVYCKECYQQEVA